MVSGQGQIAQRFRWAENRARSSSSTVAWIVGCLFLLEHPAEPEEVSAASIWKLEVTQLLKALPGAGALTIRQGRFGAASSKPTTLLHLHMPELESHLAVWELSKKGPHFASIGRDASGRFLTSRLKEYPSSLCAGMAHSLCTHLMGHGTDERELPNDLLRRCQSMQADFGSCLGQDFAF